MNELLKLSLVETVDLIKSKKISVKEIIEAYIRRLEDTEKYNMLSEKNYDEALELANIVDSKKKKNLDL